MAIASSEYRQGRLDFGEECLEDSPQFKEMVKAASARQVGGNHYKQLAIQPSFFCEMNNLSHLTSQVVKYIVRANLGGKLNTPESAAEDRAKAKHCIELIDEWIGTRNTYDDGK